MSQFITLFMFCACQALWLQGPSNTNFQDFCRKLTRAIEMKIPPGEIEEFVKKKASLNTIRKYDAFFFNKIVLEPDPKHLDHFFEESEIRHLVYWFYESRPSNRVVGVYWTKGNKIGLFFGIVGL